MGSSEVVSQSRMDNVKSVGQSEIIDIALVKYSRRLNLFYNKDILC